MSKRKWKNYGIPYQGSKNRVIAWLCQNLPGGDAFVDLFCGGCSVTHYMMTQGRYRRYIINDINPMLPETFVSAIRGKFRDERRWISRQDFYRLRTTDPYAAICFSFGNNMRDYSYCETIEPYRRACHEAVVFNEWSGLQELCPEVWEVARRALDRITPVPSVGGHRDGCVFPIDIVSMRRLSFSRAILYELRRLGDAALIDGNPLYSSCHRKPHSPGGLSDLEPLESLERLERLTSLERLERLTDVECHSGDYQSVAIPEGSVVYCDIPYKARGGYRFSAATRGFDHQRFYDWALSRPFPVFVSEYSMPEGFTCISASARLGSMAATTAIKTIERLYVQDRFAPAVSRDLFMR